MVAVGVERDDEPGVALVEDVTEPGDERLAAVRRRHRDDVDRESEPVGLLACDADRSVGRVVVDEQDVEIEPGASEDRRRLLDLGEHGLDRSGRVVGGHHDGAAHEVRLVVAVAHGLVVYPDVRP